ncbi:MAG: hypothetical protein HY431_00400 [Candidatus Levybacteria bacterium]|nr:hypothetical protein [Candidatus Levybacteria bacterium]
MDTQDDDITDKRTESDTLKQQIKHFLNFLEEYNAKRPSPRPHEDYKFLRDFFPKFIDDNNKRIDEVKSEAYKKALRLAEKQFPHKLFWVLCLDGRVLTILIYGGSAGIDDSIRVPGGILREFVRGKDGKFHLQKNSVYAQLLKRALDNSPTGAIAEIFDSHVGCAARKAEEASRGRYPKDNGLLTDVLHKKQMLDAVWEFVQKAYNGTKKIFPIQTSFDPHTGFLYMGLATDDAVAYARKHGNAYTEKVLNELARQGKIISAEAIADDPRIKKLFNEHDFSLAWKTHYAESAQKFWQAVADMKKAALQTIEEELKTVFPYLREGSNKDIQDELALRAMLLLANAFSGYLENKHPEILDGKKGEKKTRHQYAYGVHEEEGIKVTEGGYPPQHVSTFSVFSLIEKKLPAHLELAALLVRSNRLEERIQDHSSNFTDPKEFAKAPIPVIMQEIIRDDRLLDADWKAVEGINWSDLAQINWDQMTYEEFDNYIESKGKIAQPIANAMIKLKRKMGIIFNAQRTIAHHLVNHDQVVLPVLTDHNRRIRIVLPFVKLGFE